MNDPSNDTYVNRNVLLVIILISSFFNPFMAAAVNIALPQISIDLGLNAVNMSWVAMSFLLTSAVFLVPFGKLADMLGRRNIFLYGNIVFTIATLLCGLSVSKNMLIASRLMQGLGSAMVFSTGMALIISAFPPQERGKIIGLNTSVVYVGLSAAPFLGGILTEWLGWRSIFLINAVIGFLITGGIILKVRAEWVEAHDEKFDYIGSLIYIIAITAIMYGFSHLPNINAVVILGAGLVGLAGFIYLEQRIASPVLNIKLFRENKTFSFSNLAALINYAATFAITFVLSLYLQNVKGLSPKDAGLILITQPVFMAVVSSISGRMSDKNDPRILSSLGMGIIVFGLIMLAFVTTDSGNIYLLSALMILGVGFGLFSSPNTNAVMSSVEKRYLGIASATLSTMRMTGQMLSIAIAAMAIHMFLGNAKISAANAFQFMHAMKVIFIVFAVLCVLGVFASLARGKKGEEIKKMSSR